MTDRLLSFSPSIEFLPFPFGTAPQIFDPAFYDELSASFPAIELFEPANRRKDTQYKLNHKNRPAQYKDFVQRTPSWREVDALFRSNEFGRRILSILSDKGVKFAQTFDRPHLLPTIRRAAADVLKRRRWPRYPEQLRTRFSFAAYPAHGGYIRPHTDATNTLVTLVISMNRTDEPWGPAWGGELELSRPVDPARLYNWVNRVADFDEVEPIRTYPMKPNQGSFFIKTYDSWHCVRPMKAPESAAAWRKIILLVLETD